MFVVNISETTKTLLVDVDYGSIGPDEEPAVEARLQRLFDSIPSMVAKGNEAKQRKRDNGVEDVPPDTEVPTTRSEILEYLQPIDYNAVGLELVDVIDSACVLTLD